MDVAIPTATDPSSMQQARIATGCITKIAGGYHSPRVVFNFIASNEMVIRDGSGLEYYLKE